MYRVGDYVYFECSSSAPYQIRRIEELNKTPNGNVEAKVMCFYRRRDLSSTLILLADKHQTALEEERECQEEINEKHRHRLKHRELFLSRQVETLPATHIRGKCTVTLLNEAESLISYANEDDAYFYSLVYDPQQKTLLADKGEIKVGSRYQADSVPKTTSFGLGDDDGRSLEELETPVWTPDAPLSDKQIDQFMVIARSVGTFARALDCTSSVRQPSLHMSAAAASRDVTLLHAMNILHKHNYDVSKAISSLVPSGGPVLCRDEMEEWSASEANLFEEALDKYGKDFNDIRKDFLPWKTLKSIVEYYYMWKTTDRYVQQKRLKAAEAESKLKQVYIPNYNKPNPAAISKPGVNGDANGAGRNCESCNASSSSQWYAWGPSHMNCRLCSNCWNYWKKHGGLKMPTQINGDRTASTPRLGSTDGSNEGTPDRAGSVGRDSTPSSHAQIKLTENASTHLQPHRPNRCSVPDCAKEFKLKAHLDRHLATAHGIEIGGGGGGGGGSAIGGNLGTASGGSLSTASGGSLGGVGSATGLVITVPSSPCMNGSSIGGVSGGGVTKTKVAFSLVTTPLCKVARRLANENYRPHRAACHPFVPLDAAAIVEECLTKLPSLSRPVGEFENAFQADAYNKLTRLPEGAKSLLPTKKRYTKRPDMGFVTKNLGVNVKTEKPEILARQPRHEGPETIRYPVPQGGIRPSFAAMNAAAVNREAANTSVAVSAASVAAGSRAGTASPTPAPGVQMPLAKSLKRPAEQPAESPYVQPEKQMRAATAAALAQVHGMGSSLGFGANGSRAAPGGRLGPAMRNMDWTDTPKDVFFMATDNTSILISSKKVRRGMTTQEIRRAARKPWRRLAIHDLAEQRRAAALAAARDAPK